MTDLPQSTTRYISAARDNFNALTSLYNANGQHPCDDRVSFWKLGNTFDTMIDFLDVIDPSSAPKIAQMVVVQLNAALNCIKGGWDGAWFDDFGWWSVAAQRALRRPYFKNNPEPFQNILTECWTRFNNNAHGIELELTQCVPTDASVKLSRLRLCNRSSRSRLCHRSGLGRRGP